MFGGMYDHLSTKTETEHVASVRLESLFLETD